MLYINCAVGYSKNTNKRSKPDCDRLVLNDSGKLPLKTNVDNKYIEFIKFRNISKNNKGVAICLAYNPKLGECNKFDRTNQKISNYLKSNNYAGYILLNFYSLLSTDARSLNTSGLSVDQYGIATTIIENTTYPIFLCYGKNHIVALKNSMLKKTLESEYDHNRDIYFSIDKNNQFVHVGCRCCGGIYMPNFIKYNATVKFAVF